MKELESLRKLTDEILQPGIEKAKGVLYAEAGKVATITSQHASEEIRQALENEKNIRRRTTTKEVLTDEEIRNMLNYKPFVDGKTIGQWFGDLQYKNTNLIFHSIQNGVIVVHIFYGF